MGQPEMGLPGTDGPAGAANEHDATTAPPAAASGHRDAMTNQHGRPADSREQVADEREQVADQREQVADERDRVADARDEQANAREERLDAREQQLEARIRRLRVNVDERVDDSRDAIQHGLEALDRSRARLLRAEAALAAGANRTNREQAEIDREISRTIREDRSGTD
jgi:hypothetical protein